MVSERDSDRLFNTEVAFVHWLADLMERHPAFSQIMLEPMLSPRGAGRSARADLMAVRASATGSETLLIECKNRPLYGRLIPGAIQDVKRYGSLQPDANLVIALPGRIADADLTTFVAEKVEVWDLDTISRMFRDQLGNEPFRLAAALAPSSPSRETPEEVLIRELHECTKGKAQWSIYQKLVGRILEHCFCPPLNAPLSESPDESGVNRRDYVLANIADSGFWNHMRVRYSADYIVVDAKNYAGKVKKRDVLQMANYLKHHGAGLFGIIFSRNGADNSARITAREQWAHYQKLVIIIDDEGVEAIINGAPSGESAQILAKEIQDFRLRM